MKNENIRHYLAIGIRELFMSEKCYPDDSLVQPIVDKIIEETLEEHTFECEACNKVYLNEENHDYQTCLTEVRAANDFDAYKDRGDL